MKPTAKVFERLLLLLAIGLMSHVRLLSAQSAPFTPTRQATGTVTIVNGFVVGANLVDGGAGYPGEPQVSVLDPSGSNAVIVAVISSDGTVTNLSIENAGGHYSPGATLFIAPPPTNASRTDINVIIGSHVTDNIRTWTSGTNYPVGGGYTNYAGVSFYLVGFPGITNGLGVIYAGLGSPTAPLTNNFPVHITNAVMVYTLMNSFDGQLGDTNGTMDFYGSSGAHARFNIVQGVNIRDHYNGHFQNTISSNIMSLYWGASNQVRLDCQGWMLPQAFGSEVLTNIQLRSFGNRPDGVPVLAAITVRTAGPVMALRVAGDQVICSWPSTPTNYVLQSSAGLANSPWLIATNGAVVLHNQFVATNPVTWASQFFRLTVLP